MSGFRPGDVDSPVGRLRLTVGGLAELARAFGADGPSDLADRLRAMDEVDARTLLRCLCVGAVETWPSATVASALPHATRCIADAVSGHPA